jgi:hypothetical protein
MGIFQCFDRTAPVSRRPDSVARRIATSPTCLTTGRAKIATLIAEQFGEVAFLEPPADPEKDDVGDRVVKKMSNLGHDDTLSKGPRTMSHRSGVKE